MECKKFNYKNYKGCTFSVGNYLYNPQCMSIQISNMEDGPICTCTVNMNDYFYCPNSTTIKNYSENKGMTDFLIKLGIIEEVYSKVKCNPFSTDNETIDFCAINIEKLKEYSSEFNYEFKLN